MVQGKEIQSIGYNPYLEILRPFLKLRLFSVAIMTGWTIYFGEKK